VASPVYKSVPAASVKVPPLFNLALFSVIVLVPTVVILAPDGRVSAPCANTLLIDVKVKIAIKKIIAGS
jgi:hypothetical protein